MNSNSFFIFSRFLVLAIFNILLLPVYIIVSFLCFLMTLLPLFPTKTARKNLRNQLNLGFFSATFFLMSVYLNYFFYFLEASLFHVLGLNFSFLIDKEKVIQDYQAARRACPTAHDRGFVYLLGHTANFELLAQPILALEENCQIRITPLYALAKPARSAVATRLLERYRRRSRLGLIWTQHGFLKTMQKVIVSDRASLCLLVDQKPRSGGLFLKFFNEFAAFPTSGLRLCIEQRMIVLYAAGKRFFPGCVGVKLQFSANGHLLPSATESKTGSLDKAQIADEKNIKERDRPAAQEMSHFVFWLESEIKKNPTQWCWDYKKWSRAAPTASALEDEKEEN